MQIDFTAAAPGENPGHFTQGLVTLVSYDEKDNALPLYVIEPGNGYNTASKTTCTLPNSNPVALGLLVFQPVTVKAYDMGLLQVGFDQNFDVSPLVQRVVVNSAVVRVDIFAQDRTLFEAYVSTLEWTPI
jgi:hypothetical protein